MSINTNWDVERYKTDYESEEHWMLRKRFMEIHKDKFPEDELVCLAQVFTNIEFMGCKYPDETMELVANLSQEVAKDFRNDRSKRLKRTFVKASDAAEAKAKGVVLKSDTKSTSMSVEVNSKHEIEHENEEKNSIYLGKRSQPQDNSSSSNGPGAKRIKTIDLFDGLPFGKFVLYDCGDRNAIRMSGQKCNINIAEKESVENENKRVDTVIGGQIAGIGYSTNLKEAKALSFEEAFNNLSENCYTIKPTLNPDRIDIRKDNQTISCNLKSALENVSKIDSTNVGFKMMQKLGWSGGALGTKNKGIENPIDFLIKNNRKGLGNNNCVVNEDYFREMLINYVKSDDIRDLYFEFGFTKDERATLHKIASEINLKSSSYGKEPNRYLVISKKTITPYQILDEVLFNNNSMYINKYEVRVPKQKAHLFPEYTEFKA